MTTETAVLAGGCFWGMQDLIRKLPGVKATRVGYVGGKNDHPTYRNHPGHAEALEIVFDNEAIGFRDLLEFFFQIHDPSTMNRQGNDIGTSYRSAIFPQNPVQRAVAAAYIAQLGAAKAYPAPIVTRLEDGGFYPAESYHQDFYKKNPTHPYIVRWDKPKIAALRAAFPQLAS